ncbi:MAG: hypothetical protein AB1627_16740 [Chloroflexota bacterium]
MPSTPTASASPTAPRPGEAPAPDPTGAEPRTPDERWNRQVSRLMHEAAEERERRERARATEDDLLARREAAALLALIRARVRPDARAAEPRQSRGAARDRRR